MVMPYETEHGLMADCQEKYQKYLPEGLEHHPDATASHLVIRSETMDDYQAMAELATRIGITQSAPFGEKFITFVRLDKSLQHEKMSANYLEIISPDPDPDKQAKTGVQMLVFTGASFEPRQRYPTRDNSGFVLSYQVKTAAELSGLTP